MQTINLNGSWTVLPAAFECAGEPGLAQTMRAQKGWIPARVPGEIHLDLIRAGQMPEPVIGVNMPACRWPETKSWWYRTAFEFDPDFLQHERQQLVFDGLDLYAQVFVNGRLAGESANAFVPAVFDAKRFLQAGRNELVVRLTAGSELARDEKPPGQEQPPLPTRAAHGAIPNPDGRLWPGRKWLRKPQFAYGWDWTPALPNIGIWRGARLEGRRHAVLRDLRLDTLRRGNRVCLEMEAVVENLHAWSERACVLLLEIQPPAGGAAIRRRYAVNAPPGCRTVGDMIEIPKARFWWPNGMGDQPLYQVAAQVVHPDRTVHDCRQFAIGLRTIELDRSPLPEGSRFCFRINGRKAFCRGVNIGPHDVIPARVTDAKCGKLVAEAKNANMNMIRINGCAIYEAPAFYDACDHAGILIWQDFMLTCATYPEENRPFCEAIRNEAGTIIASLRHHPSLALWCGNNECAWGFRDWWNADKTKPLDVGGQKLYNQLLPDSCRHLDPKRPYWPSSPCGGEAPNSELDGDCHWWGPAFMNPDLERRLRHETYDECRARFVSEYGVIGPCHLDSIKEYLAAGERYPDSKAWQFHTNTFEKGAVLAAIRRFYAEPERLSARQYALYGQMFQAVIHGYAMEALRFRKNDPQDDCQGALVWSYSDCWGETGWSLLDYYLRRKPSYYWFRRACAPVKVIVRQRGNQLITRIVNDTLQTVHATLELGWWRLDGGGKEAASRPVKVLANDMLEVGAAPVPAPHERDPRAWVYAAVLRNAQRTPFDQSIWTFRPYRQLALTPAQPVVRILKDGWREISAPVFAHAVHAEDHGRELLSDNWFDLLPDVPVRVRLAGRKRPAALRLKTIRCQDCILP
ncbi:MAG: hypothetical protein HY360_12995 [Verrucomicrobia bacterium]|nr:hypothetical protein [Verrucomicrobiota bacterium]